MTDRLSDRLASPPARASARKRANTDAETRQETRAELTRCDRRKVIPTGHNPRPPRATLGGSNRMLSSRDVAAILAIPERTVRDKWREWGLSAYRIGKHLRWKERDVYAWIERQSA
jgi:excisionase family DNA binding protein